MHPRLVQQAIDAVSTVDGIEAVRDLRIRWVGHTLRAEADILVSPTLTVVEGHDLAHHAQDHLLAYVRRLTDASIHVSPAGSHSDDRSAHVPLQ